ncbi:bifunctional 2-polyprenyl-6-hydroxyphenol methylase/3-demethylubiquinol 3-O-methyltransferase UbiG [Bacteriovorax sp. BAL6_X]|uniref:class I SAM-dependent methyltransferase n=1 Tax=Bacteriovorax sp. BAL6_X TaxID=1201290 RepID=UPI0006981E83|nr:class I SAM-dependent methyltransferase [Bacteriovorax sp. BAL6_X]
MKKALLLKLIIILSCLFRDAFARQSISGSRYELLTGQRVQEKASNMWDKKFAQHDYIYGKSPAHFLAKNYQQIPRGATVLDIGMGEGRNAVFLASKGYKVTGVDISSVAIDKSLRLARQAGVRIKTIHKSVDDLKIANNSLDAIICFYYVDREVSEKLKKWLRPGGVIIYEGYTTEHKKKYKEQSVDSYFLKPAELLSMFNDFKILKYEEPRHNAELTQSIIAQKPE